jgi:opacity protein-like surface antigen
MRRVLIAAAGLALAASPAFAQVDPDDTPPPATSTPGGDAGTGSAAPGATASAAIGLGGTPIISRSLTLPGGRVGIYGDLDFVRTSKASVTIVNGMPQTTTTSANALGIHLGGGYGINDQLTVGAEYAFSLADFELRGPLALYGSYGIYSKGKLTIGVTGALGFDFTATTTDPMTMMTSSTVNVALALGAAVRYAITPQIALYTGNPIAPGILGSQLELAFNNSAPITLNIPIGAAFQATPQLYAFAQTELVNIGLAHSGTTFLFADFLPLEIGGFYTVNKNLDLGATFNFGDLEHGVNALNLDVAARYYD